jgi:hypothetical protein
MRKFGRLISLACLLAAASRAGAAPPGTDPNWPCHQPKVGDYPLASVWDGPAIEGDPSQWRSDSQVAALAATMAERRAPITQVQAGVAKLAAAPEGKPKVLHAFGAAFDELVRQRAEIIAGLTRYGRKNLEMADHIRAENVTAHQETRPGAGLDEAALQKLQWDLRVFEDRRRTASYVCEAPQAIEARIGEIVKTVRAAL